MATTENFNLCGEGRQMATSTKTRQITLQLRNSVWTLGTSGCNTLRGWASVVPLPGSLLGWSDSRPICAGDESFRCRYRFPQRGFAWVLAGVARKISQRAYAR